MSSTTTSIAQGAVQRIKLAAGEQMVITVASQAVLRFVSGLGMVPGSSVSLAGGPHSFVFQAPGECEVQPYVGTASVFQSGSNETPTLAYWTTSDGGQTWALIDPNGSVFSPTVSFNNPTFSGRVTIQGQESLTPAAVSANQINFNVAKNTMTLGADTTVTFGGSPATDDFTVWYLTGDTSQRTVTLPANVRSISQQATIANFIVPANWKGPIFLTKTASGYDIEGEPVALANKGFARSFGSGANDTKILALASPFAGTITDFYTICASGTANYQLQINGVSVTGGLNAVSSNQVHNQPSANNVINVGDKVTVVRTSDATCVNADLIVWVAPVKA